jgi:hypothetical protein
MKQSSITKSNILGTALLTAAMSLPALDFASAESAPERGMVSFKYLNYSESQTVPGTGGTSSSTSTTTRRAADDLRYDLISGASTVTTTSGGGTAGTPGSSADRIKVNAYTVSTLVPVAGKWSVGLNYTYDSVTGASPQYHTSALTNMHDRRNAGDLAVTRYFSQGTVTVGGSYSSETDYISRGYSVLGSLSSADKNTTWSLGASLTDDTIMPQIPGATDKSKKAVAGLVGVTRVLTKNDITQFNLGYSHGTGYFSDPYKYADNRPGTRNMTTLMTRWNHHFEGSDGTARLSYRFYSDSFGIRAHTLDAEYVQPISNGWTVMPLLRLYSQNEADFYIATNSPAETAPTPVPAGQVFSSEDERMSAFGALTLGIKVAKKLTDDISFDIKYENYLQRSDWALSGKKDSGLAEFNAHSIQVGVTCLF